MTPLDLSTAGGRRGAKQWVAIALIGAALILAVALIALYLVPREDPTVVKLPTEYPFRCTQCSHEWSADQAGVTRYFRGGLPTTLSPVDCPSCGRKGAAYMMARCPWCQKHYIHPHLLKAQAGRPKEDICPHCGKDVLKWRR